MSHTTMTQSKWVTVWETVCQDVNTWVWPGYEILQTGKAQVSGGTLVITANTSGDGVSFGQTVVPGVWQTLTLSVNRIISGSGLIQVLEEQNGVMQSLGIQSFHHAGEIKLTFKPTQPYITYQILGPVIAHVDKICFDKPVLKQENVLVDICPEVKDKYRFGFNGQEKVNEWAGMGNYLDYTWRGYDTRTGRFISKDPLMRKFPYYTPYQFAGNTPIQAIDLDGREELHYTTRTWMDGDGNTQVDTRMSTEINALGHGNNGIWMSDINEIEGYARDWYIPDAVIEGTRIYKDTDPRSGVEKFAERNLTRLFRPAFNVVERFDEKMDHAQYVGLRLKYAIEDKSTSLKGSFGVQSSSEDNFGFIAKHGYEKKIGLSTKSPKFDFKLQIGLYWKQKDRSINIKHGPLEFKGQGYEKISYGPFTVESNDDGTEEFIINIGKDAFKKERRVDAEVGVKGTAEHKWESKMFNLK